MLFLCSTSCHFLTPCCSLDFSHSLIGTNYTALGIGIMYSGIHFQRNTWMWFQEFMNAMNKSIKWPPKAQSAWKFILNKIGKFFGCTFVSMWPWTLQQNRYVTENGNRVTVINESCISISVFPKLLHSFLLCVKFLFSSWSQYCC